MNIHHSHLSLHPLLILAVILAGCSAQPAPAASPTSTETPSIEFSPVIQPSPSATEFDMATIPPPSQTAVDENLSSFVEGLLSVYDSLPPGMYILLRRAENIYIASPDGSFEVFLINGYRMYTLDEARNRYAFQFGEKWVEVDFIQRTWQDFQPESLTRTPTPRISGICRNKRISPDGNWCLLYDEDFFAASVDGSHRVKFAGYPQYVSLSPPAWSPDGRWISFLGRENGTGTNEGIYLLDTACLPAQNDCSAEATGPYSIGDDTGLIDAYWSPDSHKLFVLFHDQPLRILIFNIDTLEGQTVDLGVSNYTLIDMEWSPDDEWIVHALIEEGSTEIKETITNANQFTTRQIDGILTGWMSTIPEAEMFIGGEYEISPAGNHLNLRSEPSIHAGIVQNLAAGQMLECIEGPVEKDGYTWWKFRSQTDGATGWAVEHAYWYIELEK